MSGASTMLPKSERPEKPHRKKHITGAQRKKMAFRRREIALMSGGRTIEAEYVRPVKVGPLNTHSDVITELKRVYRQMRKGELLADIGGKLAYVAQLLSGMMRERQELEELTKLRQQLEALQHSGVPAVTHQQTDLNGSAALDGEYLPVPHESPPNEQEL